MDPTFAGVGIDPTMPATLNFPVTRERKIERDGEREIPRHRPIEVRENVCVRERENERDIERHRERERETDSGRAKYGD